MQSSKVTEVASTPQEDCNGTGMESKFRLPTQESSSQSQKQEINLSRPETGSSHPVETERAVAVQNMLDFLEGEDEEESSTRARDRGESVSAAKRDLYVTTEQVPVPTSNIPDETSKRLVQSLFVEYEAPLN